MFVTKKRYNEDIGNLIMAIDLLNDDMEALKKSHNKLNSNHSRQVSLLHKRVDKRKKDIDRNYALIGSLMSGLIAKVLIEQNSEKPPNRKDNSED